MINTRNKQILENKIILKEKEETIIEVEVAVEIIMEEVITGMRRHSDLFHLKISNLIIKKKKEIKNNIIKIQRAK